MTSKLNILAGTALIPTLARLVVGMAFIYLGSGKLFTDTQFDAAQAAKLRALGIELTPAPQETASVAADAAFLLASYSQSEAPPTDAQEGEVKELVPENGTGGEAAPADAAGAAVDPATDTRTYVGRRVNGLILHLERKGMQSPKLLAWGATLAEFVGGVLILLGLFTRVWGLAVAAVMVGAIYMSTWDRLIDSRLFGLKIDEFNTLFRQLGLFVMAFGLMLTGAGPLSLDRMIFGRKSTGPARSSRPHHPSDGHDDAGHSDIAVR